MSGFNITRAKTDWASRKVGEIIISVSDREARKGGYVKLDDVVALIDNTESGAGALAGLWRESTLLPAVKQMLDDEPE